MARYVSLCDNEIETDAFRVRKSQTQVLTQVLNNCTTKAKLVTSPGLFLLV
jgi:hypothetical protein